MIIAPSPVNEAERLQALHAYGLLDTGADAILDDLVRLASRLTRAPMALVSLVDSQRQWFKARHGLAATELPRETAFCAHAILSPDALFVVPDASEDPRFADNPLVTGEPHIRFYAAAPLATPEGHALGTLCVIDREPRIMSEADRETLTTLGHAVMTTLELHRMARHAQEVARHDALTGLANRPAFTEALTRAIAQQRRNNRTFSLLYLDLDGFKRVNDVLGHVEGDRVLRCVGETVRGAVRDVDLAARIGGDEFAVLLDGGDPSQAASVAARLCRALKAAMDARGWPVTASIGAATMLSSPDDAAHALAMADELMYAAKAGGRNRVSHRNYGLAFAA